MRRDSGSLLIVALVTVSVVTTLALALALWARSQIEWANQNELVRRGRRACFHGAMVCCFERLASDTNGYDSLDEDWAEPYEKEADGWIWRVSGTGWSTPDDVHRTGLVDESGKLPLNNASSTLLAALLHQEGVGESEARKLAERIVDWRDEDSLGPDNVTPEHHYHGLPESLWQPPNADFRSVGELASVPGITPAIYAAIAPCLTVQPVKHININTISPDVLLAQINASGGRGSKTAMELYNRFRAFRHDGKHFESIEPALMGRQLGALTTEESFMLSVLSTNIAIRSDIFSGVVESFPVEESKRIKKPPRATFVFDRKSNRFLHWVEE